MLTSLVLAVLALLPLPGRQDSPPRLERVAVIATEKGAEIVSVQGTTRRAALARALDGRVELFDLADPARPRTVRVVDLGLGKGEELTSVALPPQGEWFLAAVKAAKPLAAGRALAFSMAGERLASFPCGVGPDCVAIAPSGTRALVANEAEGFEEHEGRLVSAPGSLTLIELVQDLPRSRVTQIPFGLPSSAPTDGRRLERRIDGAEREVALGIGPEFLEPEVVAFLPGETRALVTLQESNLVAFVDLRGARLERLLPLGNTTHPADLSDDGRFEERGTLVARREPDGLALTSDGRTFVTADEGDTLPDVGETPEGLPAGGGRTLSVFELETGALLGDTGPELDRAAARAGLYPDHRGPRRGCEPEMVLVFERGGVPYAAVTLERAGALALVDLRDPARPAVVALERTGSDPFRDEPEGLALFRDPEGGADYLYVANEGSGTLGVLRILR